MPKGKLIPSGAGSYARDVLGVGVSWGLPQTSNGLAKAIIGGIAGWVGSKYIAGSGDGKTACKIGGLVNVADGLIEQFVGGKGVF